VFEETARYYDRIYAFKDYAAEASKIRSIVEGELRTGGRRLLDVACGTGLHLEHLKAHFDAEGLDLSPELLEVSRERNPEVTHHLADMRTFELDARFDVVTEPWLTPDAWRPNTVHGLFVDEPELKIARVNTSLTEGRVSVFDLHHLIGTTEGTRHVVEHHELGLYTIDEMTEAFAAAGLDVRYDPEGLTGRGLYIARKL